MHTKIQKVKHILNYNWKLNLEHTILNLVSEVNLKSKSTKNVNDQAKIAN